MSLLAIGVWVLCGVLAVLAGLLIHWINYRQAMQCGTNYGVFGDDLFWESTMLLILGPVALVIGTLAVLWKLASNVLEDRVFFNTARKD